MVNDGRQKALFVNNNSYRPLADRIRPISWEDYQGIDSLDSKLIENLKTKDFIPPSLILWGPPGCGKTTFAKLIETSTHLPFVSFSAVLGGVKEVREIVKTAKGFSYPTILFIDEIHRFNKSQQDAFLPHMENGTIILIGATTENPSFYLNQALLSRSKVLSFNGLDSTSLSSILNKASQELGIEFEEEASKLIIKSAGSDARKLLNLIEQISSTIKDKTQEISTSHLKKILNNPSFFYDRSGEEHYNMISAFIKSLRGSDADGALYWGLRMIECGEDPRFIIRRMIIFASEDIGNSDPRALTLATSTLSAYEHIGLPEGKIPISQCITYLATAPKSNRSYAAMHMVLDEIKQNPKSEVPLHLRNAPTKLMKELDYGKGYKYPHDYDEAYVADTQYLPDEIKSSKFYEPSDRGYEKVISERLNWLKNQN